MLTTCYRNAHGIIIVYDVTNEKSFANLKQWMAEVDEFAKPDLPKMLVKNLTTICCNEQVRFKVMTVGLGYCDFDIISKYLFLEVSPFSICLGQKQIGFGRARSLKIGRGSEYLPYKNRKHLKTGLLFVQYSNGPKTKPYKKPGFLIQFSNGFGPQTLKYHHIRYLWLKTIQNLDHLTTGQV